MLNPFDLRGPQFLLFYFALAVLVNLLIRYIYRQREGSLHVPRLDMNDPYQIAYLRGGANETLRVATVSLLDRGLLKANDEQIVTANADAPKLVKRPVEKALLEDFAVESKASDMFTNSRAADACKEYERSLKQLKLIADETIRRARLVTFLFLAAALSGVSMIKIYVAIQRGHYNILFLIILSAVSLFFLFRAYFKHRTALGDRVVKDLATLFSSLKGRADSIRPGGSTNEAALLAAVFGLGALSTVNFPYTKRLFPKGSSTSSGCGTAYGCGSSSCGSSCGGGGCGGGCGGCGG